MRRASSLAALFALTLGTIVVSASAAAAATLVVDDNLACPGAAFPTIQAAVIAAAPGDTIQVCAGVYPEVVIVNKSLTLLGAQAGNDARTRTIAAATESIVGTAGGAFVFSANNITLDGFELTGQTAAFWGTALFSQNSTSGHTIVNNYVHDNVIGMYINTNGTNLTLVEHNLLKENNNAGSTSGTAFYSDQGLQNAIVTENTFLDNDSGAFIVSPFSVSSVPSFLKTCVVLPLILTLWMPPIAVSPPIAVRAALINSRALASDFNPALTFSTSAPNPRKNMDTDKTETINLFIIGLQMC